MSNNNTSLLPENFFGITDIKTDNKPLTIADIRKAVSKMREMEVKPDIDGDVNFRIDIKTGRWVPFDERGKPVGLS